MRKTMAKTDEKSNLSRTRNLTLICGILVGISGLARILGYWGTPDAHWFNTIAAIAMLGYAAYLHYKITKL